MRQESTRIAKAFLAGKPARAARTTTDGKAVYLHGNRIAWRDEQGDVHMTLCGWPTVTTRDRLNTICTLLIDQRPFHQKKHAQYFNDNAIDAHQIITVHTLEVTPLEEWLQAAE